MLAEIYAPDLVAAEEEYLVAARMAAAMAGMAHGDPGALAAASLQRLRALDVPEDEIARLRKTGKASAAHRRARAGGWRRDRKAGAGRHAHRGRASRSTRPRISRDVWLIAEVQEQDLGLDPRRAKARRRSSSPFRAAASTGTVEFIYPVAFAARRAPARVRIVIPNPDQALRAAMYASVEIAAPAADRPGAGGAGLRRHR